MIRLLLALVIVALLLTKVSEMLGTGTRENPDSPPSPKDTIVDKAYEPYTRAQQFGDKDYEEALDAKRKSLDEQIDGG